MGASALLLRGVRPVRTSALSFLLLPADETGISHVTSTVRHAIGRYRAFLSTMRVDRADPQAPRRRSGHVRSIVPRSPGPKLGHGF